MALIHEKLYRSPDIARIEFGDYIRSLVSHIIQKQCRNPEAIKLMINCEKINFDIDIAIPAGLIINELVSNAVIHAFNETAGGELYIKVRDREMHYFLEIADNGSGIPESVNEETGGALGMQLIRTLVKQLNGVLALGRNNGTQCRVTIPH
jgi:two-component sensor histidine kinase